MQKHIVRLDFKELVGKRLKEMEEKKHKELIP